MNRYDKPVQIEASPTVQLDAFGRVKKKQRSATMATMNTIHDEWNSYRDLLQRKVLLYDDQSPHLWWSVRNAFVPALSSCTLLNLHCTLETHNLISKPQSGGPGFL